MNPAELKAISVIASAAVSITAIICLLRFCMSPNGHDTGADDCAAACQKTGVAMRGYEANPVKCTCESKP